MDNQTASSQLHSPHKLQVEWHLAYHNETLRAAMHSQTRFANDQFLLNLFSMFLDIFVSWEVGPRFFPGLCKDWAYAHISIYLYIYIHSIDCKKQHIFFFAGTHAVLQRKMKFSIAVCYVLATYINFQHVQSSWILFMIQTLLKCFQLLKIL